MLQIIHYRIILFEQMLPFAVPHDQLVLWVVTEEFHKTPPYDKNAKVA